MCVIASVRFTKSWKFLIALDITYDIAWQRLNCIVYKSSIMPTLNQPSDNDVPNNHNFSPKRSIIVNLKFDWFACFSCFYFHTKFFFQVHLKRFEPHAKLNLIYTPYIIYHKNSAFVVFFYYLYLCALPSSLSITQKRLMIWIHIYVASTSTWDLIFMLLHGKIVDLSCHCIVTTDVSTQKYIYKYIWTTVQNAF